EAGDILAVQDVAAGRGGVETAENVHEGGLPRTGGAHDRDELAALDLDRQAAERVNRVGAESIVLREPFGGDQRHGSASELERAGRAARGCSRASGDRPRAERGAPTWACRPWACRTWACRPWACRPWACRPHRAAGTAGPRSRP